MKKWTILQIPSRILSRNTLCWSHKHHPMPRPQSHRTPQIPMARLWSMVLPQTKPAMEQVICIRTIISVDFLFCLLILRSFFFRASHHRICFVLCSLRSHALSSFSAILKKIEVCDCFGNFIVFASSMWACDFLRANFISVFSVLRLDQWSAVMNIYFHLLLSDIYRLLTRIDSKPIFCV